MAGMERLTIRDSQGRVYFDNDGTLIRGANGAFHQKKDMTAHYIHDRFVALDKVIDRLVAYEDTGLTPEEVISLKKATPLISPLNDPLTMDELRGMYDEPVWCEHYGWLICCGVSEFRGYPCMEHGGGSSTSLVGYGEYWVAYRRKPGGKA